MADDKPINAMYGQKVKLDLDKLKNRKNKEVVEEPVVEQPIDEPVVEEETVEEVAEEVVEEKTSENSDTDIIGNLKQKLSEREKKLSNQSSELNYLTNKVIPKLKKENAELNNLKRELTDALEKSTRKYFDQLDINADLSNKIGKLGAESAVSKVRADKLEAELGTIKEELEAEINTYKEKLAAINVDDIKDKNKQLVGEVEDLKEKLSDSRKENLSLSDELDKLRSELIELGNYKDEVDAQIKKEIDGYKEEISSIRAQLKVKESSYDKLSNESGKTISDLRKQVVKLEEALEKESNKGLFNRFK